MPIYEYRCEACGEDFEKMVKLDAPVPACPACGAAQTRKLISASSFVLKGGGWYKDHYGLKSSKGGGSEGSSGGSSSGSSGGGSSSGSAA
ncbi:MAG: zinc ribbon domain-containing protein [Alphaproteobacteria bacterium]|nr:zinc ribbon domain-containing protein [Alphaproteobacteria bacterium]